MSTNVEIKKDQFGKSLKKGQKQLLDLDDTLMKLFNLDEIEQNLNDDKCAISKRPTVRAARKTKRRLSLKSQNCDDSTENHATKICTTRQNNQVAIHEENDTDILGQNPNIANEVIEETHSDPFSFLNDTQINIENKKSSQGGACHEIKDQDEFYNSTQVVNLVDEILNNDKLHSHVENSQNLRIKRKSLDDGNNILKQPRTDKRIHISIDDEIQTETKLEVNPTLGENLNCDNNDDIIEYRMTQLLKSNQYRKEVSELFEDLELSICQFGSKELQNKKNCPDDSLMGEQILSKLTQDCGEDITTIMKKALKQNLNKTVDTKLINSTLLTTPPMFKELGPFYGLPQKVQELIKIYKGIDDLYDWQDECLKLTAVTERKNLIYSLPTSGGKTLVAEILILREILCRKRNAIFVLPYVSIVQEKVWALAPFGVALDFLVEEYAAGKGTYPPRKRRYKNSVYIATTEKALGLINSLIENGRLGELGLIVVDELHLIGDGHRGSTLEVLLTKLMYITDDIQIVGMSATIGNLSDIRQFLNAEVYTQNFRPIELTEYVKCGNEIAKVNYNADVDHIFETSRTTTFDYSEKHRKIDPDHLGGLVMEVIPEGSCLVFCPTKKNAENVALLLCKVVSRKLHKHKVVEKTQLLKSLQNDAGTICSILNESVPFGIAYHHSGLTTEERKLIEEAYRTGVLCVICCTSTLAAGVNLPAKRVIIRKPNIAQDFINLSRYKQMVGRAGRAGLGEIGESILICKLDEMAKVKQLLISPMDQTLSKLHESEFVSLRHLFLSCIALGTANTKAQLKMVTNKTLLAVQQVKLNVDVRTIVRKVLNDLHKLEAIETPESNSHHNAAHISCFNSLSFTSTQSSNNIQTTQSKRTNINDNTKFVVSKLGLASIKGNLSITDAHLLYKDLCKAQHNLVLVNCLHLLYLVTPYNLVIKPEKDQFHYILSHLNSEQQETASVLGINDSCIVRMLSNQQIKSVPENVLNRFYMSLMLYELWNEASVLDVSEKYQINRGLVQNLMTNASTFASNVVNFCEQFERFWPFVHLLKGMSQRLAHCCCRDILPLMELPAVKQGRAKQLYNAGFTNLHTIAKSDPEHLVQSIEYMSHKIANQLIAAAKMLLLEKVENLREEAEDVLDGVNVVLK